MRPSVDERIRAISAEYPSRLPRGDLDAVERLRLAAGVALPPTRVAVVGTNGKTSTAVFAGRLLRRAGIREGVTTSPHISRWGERIAVAGEAVADDVLLAQLEALHARAQEVDGRETLRFFDLLTLAAAALFVEAGVEIAIFEAGIGGRLDATRVLVPQLTLLTGVGLDHVELLGEREVDIVREKLAVAPAGSRVLAASLRPELERAATEFAEEHGLALELVRSTARNVLLRNAELACACVMALGVETGRVDAAELAGDPVPGRMQRVSFGGVEVLLDAAHNAQAWTEIASLLPPSFVAVVSVSADRPASELTVALVAAVAVVATEAWAGRSATATDLAAALGGADAVDDPVAAVKRGLDIARRRDVPLVVLGSAYLLPHAYAALEIGEGG
jgi:dihydrofolate synthase / folylpolyglutamate synthase